MLKFDDQYTNNRVADLYSQEEERAIQAHAPQLGFEYINLRGYTINPEAISVIPEEKSRAVEAIAFALNRHTLSVAVKNPNNPKTQTLLEELQKQRYTISLFICSTASLEYAQERYKDINDSSAEKKGVFEISAEDIARLTDTIKQKDDVLKILQNINNINNNRRISETLELVFAGALALSASDIHIEPEKEAIRLRYRFDGVLHNIANLDNYIYKRIMSRLKLLSGMILNSRAEAQDGRFTFATAEKEVEVRSSVIPSAIGDSIVMRLLDPTVASFSLEKVRLSKYLKEVVVRELKKPNGLIITTGPTGSGKTTALYAFLKETHSEGVKIITIENPVEYKLKGIVQTQIGDDYTFSSGLRAILRQDPDVIMIGEIRDREVAETAIHAAQTGHLVFSTLHTNSAIAGFPRLIDLGVDPRIMGSSINIIIGQRLVRLLCQDCKSPRPASAAETQLIEYIMSGHPYPIEINLPLTLHNPVGCDICKGTGYKGRAGIFEGVVMDEAVEEVVIRDPREHIIAEAAKPQKIPNMLEDGIEKIITGLTSLQELERVIELPYLKATTQKENTTPAVETPDDAETDFLSHVS